MTMITNGMTLRVAALAVFAAILLGMAAPHAAAASKKKNETQTYTVTYKDYGDCDVTDTVTYQIGGKTITVKRSYTFFLSDGTTQIDETIDTYVLSKPLNALSRPDNEIAVLDVPAGTKITKGHMNKVIKNGEILDEDSEKVGESYMNWAETGCVFSRYEMDQQIPAQEDARGEEMWEYGLTITVEKGKTYQLCNVSVDGEISCPGNLVFRGV